MEEFTLTLLQLLRIKEHDIDWSHVDTSINRKLEGRERFRLHKLARLAKQVVQSTNLAVKGYGAYYQISQGRIGLVRDLCLLLPFRLAGRRMVVHLHGGLLDTFLREEKVLAVVLRWALRDPRNRGIVLTQSLKHCLAPLLPPERIIAVANTATVPKWTRAKEFDGTLHVLYVGSLIETKGYRELAAAVQELSSKGVSVELDLVGEPFTESDAKAAESLAKHSAIRVRGVLTGDEKWKAFHRSHILALPTRYPPEGQPISIIEAMGAGCAILSTKREGILDTVSEKEAILLDPEAGETLQYKLEAVLAMLAKDYSEVKKRGVAASQLYDRSFTPRQFFDRWKQAVTP